MRVTISVEQTLLGGQTNSRAIDFYGATFKHKRMCKHRHAEQLGNILGDLIVMLVSFIFAAPAIEDPVVDRQWIIWSVAHNKRWAVVAHPNVYRGIFDNADIFHYRTGGFQPEGDILSRQIIINQKTNLLVRRQRQNHLNPNLPDA